MFDYKAHKNGEYMTSTSIKFKKRRLTQDILVLNRLIDEYHNEIDALESLAAKAKQTLSESVG